MSVSPKRAKQLRAQVLLLCARVLENTADGAEFPPSRNDEEDEWMREEMRNIATDLYEEGHLP